MSTVLRWILSKGLVAVALMAASAVDAQELRVDLVATGALGIDTNHRCEKDSTDTVACTAPVFSPTLELAAELRPFSALGFGTFVGMSRLSAGDDRLLRFGAELKWHPLATLLPGAWIGASGGFAKLQGSSPQQGALIGGSLGVDFTLFEWLLLGVGTRVEYLNLGSSNVLGQGLPVGSSRYEGGVRAWLGLRMGVTF
jgi:hypothetical protein